MSVALLERAVDYTRGQLALVSPSDFGAPTPCREWDLADLLAHMEDSLDAFIEASQGVVSPFSLPVRSPQLDRLRTKACHLLGCWAAHSDPDSVVAIGDRHLAAATVLEAAALEIAIHGWDVGQAVQALAGLPEPLARALRPVAARMVTPDVRSGRFDDPIGLRRLGAKYAHLQGAEGDLLAFLGRMTLQSHLPQP